MQAIIYCEPTSKGVHSFYLVAAANTYFLFNQDYRKGVHKYFSKGVRLKEATDFSKSRRDTAIEKTMAKIPMYVKYVEKEYGIIVLEQTKRKYRRVSFSHNEACA